MREGNESKEVEIEVGEKRTCCGCMRVTLCAATKAKKHTAPLPEEVQEFSVILVLKMSTITPSMYKPNR